VLPLAVELTTGEVEVELTPVLGIELTATEVASSDVPRVVVLILDTKLDCNVDDSVLPMDEVEVDPAEVLLLIVVKLLNVDEVAPSEVPMTVVVELVWVLVTVLDVLEELLATDVTSCEVSLSIADDVA